MDRTAEVMDLVYALDNKYMPKSVKEQILGRIRQIERETGQRFYGNYNGGGASRNPSEMARVEEENA